MIYVLYALIAVLVAPVVIGLPYTIYKLIRTGKLEYPDDWYLKP